MENRLIIDNIVLMPDMGRGGPSRKGQQTASGGRHTMVTRPRDAASLILLRGEGRTLEVLAGRRRGARARISLTAGKICARVLAEAFLKAESIK